MSGKFITKYLFLHFKKFPLLDHSDVWIEKSGRGNNLEREREREVQ